VPFAREEVARSIPERFARIVAAAPDALAIAAGAERLTYAELDRQSDAMADAIGRRTAGSGAPVALLLGDPVTMVAGLLGAWKAGKLCVPLDPAYPEAQITAIFQSSEAGLVVADRPGGRALDRAAADRLSVEEIDLRAAVDLPPMVFGVDPLACVLYTSGSTGAPKGVMRGHRDLLHRAWVAIDSLAMAPGDRISALHSPGFGAGLRDVLMALLSGAALMPFDLRRAGLRALAKWIDGERISVLCTVVTTFRQLMGSLGEGERFRSVRAVRLGSEPLYRQDVVRFRERFAPGCLLVAGYGASETSGITEYRLDAAASLPSGQVPAGHPVEGVEILVLSEAGQPVADGEAGEVAVRSRFLARGYWRRPDLTSKAFLPDDGDPDTRIYRTGDVGRLRQDGCLEVLGRKDEQLKVRGFLVHPGEVELALAEHPEIREAVVVGRPGAGGQMRLVAYVVPGTSPAPSAQALRAFLRARVPVHLVPSAFVTLAVLPVNANGKVDRAALPTPATSAIVRDMPFVPLRTPLEHQIALIWEDLLDARPIGARDDFFDLGGDSLLAAAFVAAIEEACGRPMAPSALFEASTVAGVAATLVRDVGPLAEPVTAIRAAGAGPPLFFFHGDFHEGGLYCRVLARHLDPDRPFYAVHPHGLDGGEVPPTIEAMAVDRLAAVRAVRPHGPYLLAGHCNGGLVALEMARRLDAAGERVEVVGLVDAAAPGLGLRAMRGVAEAIGRVRGLPPEARADLFARMERGSDEVGGWARYYRGRLRTRLPSALGRGADRAGRELGRLARALGASRRGRPGVPAALDPDPRRRAYRRAIRRYAPGPYAGRLALFSAEERDARGHDLGWSRLAPRLEVIRVPGDHHTCITRHAAAFGARLERALGERGSHV
jgi:amino acid adenylation domain-containing protein